MDSENVQIEMVGKVAVATICNPPANALTPELRMEFMTKLGELSENDQVWSLIITGDGEKFFIGRGGHTRTFETRSQRRASRGYRVPGNFSVRWIILKSPLLQLLMACA